MINLLIEQLIYFTSNTITTLSVACNKKQFLSKDKKGEVSINDERSNKLEKPSRPELSPVK